MIIKIFNLVIAGFFGLTVFSHIQAEMEQEMGFVSCNIDQMGQQYNTCVH